MNGNTLKALFRRERSIKMYNIKIERTGRTLKVVGIYDIHDAFHIRDIVRHEPDCADAEVDRATLIVTATVKAS